jgi:hypothetical protein
LSSYGFLGLVAFATAAEAQQPRTITAADYMRAAKFLAPNLNGMVVGGSVSPTWLLDDRRHRTRRSHARAMRGERDTVRRDRHHQRLHGWRPAPVPLRHIHPRSAKDSNISLPMTM